MTHHNTEHPHVHVALRGVDSNGRSLRLDRDYIKTGMRGIAKDLCTRQLGYRSEKDADESSAREIREHRFTLLDRCTAGIDSVWIVFLAPRQYVSKLLFMPKAMKIQLLLHYPENDGMRPRNDSPCSVALRSHELAVRIHVGDPTLRPQNLFHGSRYGTGVFPGFLGGIHSPLVPFRPTVVKRLAGPGS